MIKAVEIKLNNSIFQYAKQENDNWCWAASIQMVFNHYGIIITQKQIVARTFGTNDFENLPNWTVSFKTITSNLNNWTIDNSGKWFFITSLYDKAAPETQVLINELKQNKPVIIGYKKDPFSSHVVVITGVEYINDSKRPIVTKLIVRDPWPDRININNSGIKEFSSGDLISSIIAHWTINVKENITDQNLH